MFLYSYTNLSLTLCGVVLISFMIQQILTMTIRRYFYTTSKTLAAEKSLLAALRKKTGYTFSNCKKALEMHNNDMNQAETWLREQAQSLGWSKATKLEGRQTSQGLVGVAINENNGILVEVNCETDFVARNKEFQSMVEEAANTCLNYVSTHQKPQEKVTKVSICGNVGTSVKQR